jgi:hypothetical protein
MMISKNREDKHEMTEPHETFTWYDYPAKRNKRILIKRFLMIATMVIIYTGGVLWLVM